MSSNVARKEVYVITEWRGMVGGGLKNLGEAKDILKIASAV